MILRIAKIIERSGAKPTDMLDEQSLGDLVMAPTRIYVKSVLAAFRALPGALKGLAHITGGGITENVPRILQAGLTAEIQRHSWERPALFNWLQEAGGVADDEMHRVFNCGIGMVIVVAPENADAVSKVLAEHGEQVSRIGSIRASEAGEAPTVVV